MTRRCTEQYTAQGIVRIDTARAEKGRFPALHLDASHHSL